MAAAINPVETTRLLKRQRLLIGAITVPVAAKRAGIRTIARVSLAARASHGHVGGEARAAPPHFAAWECASPTIHHLLA